MGSLNDPTPNSAAQLLTNSGLEAPILLPNTPSFANNLDTYWSNTAKLTPACIVCPRSAQEVSLVIKTLAAAQQPFALRSGGHTQFAGGNNIQDGVVIDLSHLNWTRFDSASETVDIGPGARWRTVYAELQKHGRVVAGGRDGNVGVGGILLGGGKTFFTAKRGFACDDVVAYEVVLADGRIVMADQETNEDLFRVLKGGSNNFGVVTNFKMRALKCERIWGGLNIFQKQVAGEAIRALVEFTNNAHGDEDSHLLFFFTYMVSTTPTCFSSLWTTNTVIVAAYVQLAGIENAPAYSKFLNLPSPLVNSTKMTTVATVVSEYDIAPKDYYNTFFTACFKNDPSIVAKASELHDELVTDLQAFIPDGNFVTQCLVQPLPTHYGRKSAEAGGNIMGVEQQPCNGLLFVAVVMVKTPEQEGFAYPRVQAWLERLKVFAATMENGNLPWIYLNYADKSQDVLGSYGKENLRKMREVARKYDPEQVFQLLCPGGFKISNVKGKGAF